MRSRSISALVAACAGLMGVSGAMAQIVVLDARGPSASAFPQGAVLAPNRMITLKAGDRLEVIDAAGSHVLNGPLSMSTAQVDTGSKVALQDIFKRANASRPSIAAVRGFSLDEGKPAPVAEVPPLWRVDLDALQGGDAGESHNFCVASGHAPVLTRGSTVAEGKLSIYDDATKATHTVSWPAGARDLVWPSGVSYQDGGLYALNLDDAGAAQVRWRTVPSQATSLTVLARSLLDNGCYDQLDALQSQVAAK